jgi:hypothetical protein
MDHFFAGLGAKGVVFVGRLMVMVATPFLISYRMSSYCVVMRTPWCGFSAMREFLVLVVI